jgi:hypothetical protein
MAPAHAGRGGQVRLNSCGGYSADFLGESDIEQPDHDHRAADLPVPAPFMAEEDASNGN